MDLLNIVNNSSYDFLAKEKSLGSNIILLTLGGSHSYGTNNEDSDVDIRGCTLENPSDLIGFSNFEQFIDKETDTVIYGFNKLIPLLLNSNPNTIEMLGCKDEHYLFLSDVGEELLKNRKMFLSKRCISSFGGYAYQQLNRLNNSLARDRFSQKEKEEHMLNSVKSAILSFENRYSKMDEGSIILKVAKSSKVNLDSEIFLNVSLEDYPLRDFSGMISEMQSILKSYDKLNHRNRKKTKEGIAKHMMHLIRLYIMAIDILEKEEIITYRKNERKLLLDIRKGKYMKNDGTCHDSFFEMMEEYKKRFEYAAENTSLPSSPDVEKVEEFVMEVNKKIINGG